MRESIVWARGFARLTRQGRVLAGGPLALALASCALEVDREVADTVDDVAVTTQELSAPPDQQCAVATYGGHEYWFCNQNRTWAAARTRCQASGLDLAHVDNAAENAFIYENLATDAWIGSVDSAIEGAWRWSDDNLQHWSGAVFGSSVAGRYNNWKLGQPDNFFNQDCNAMELFAVGRWADRACTESLDFVCERALSPGEPATECTTLSAPAGSPWPRFRRCGTGQARTPLVGASEPTPVASYSTTGAIVSSPAIGADGTVYVGSRDGRLYAFHSDGSERWTYVTGGPIDSSPAIGADGVVYVGSNDNKLHAINPDGTGRWMFPTGGDVRSSPVVGSDGTIYIGSDDFSFRAIRPNGTERWNRPTLSKVRGTAVISRWNDLLRIRRLEPSRICPGRHAQMDAHDDRSTDRLASDWSGRHHLHHVLRRKSACATSRQREHALVLHRGRPCAFLAGDRARWHGRLWKRPRLRACRSARRQHQVGHVRWRNPVVACDRLQRYRLHGDRGRRGRRPRCRERRGAVVLHGWRTRHVVAGDWRERHGVRRLRRSRAVRDRRSDRDRNDGGAEQRVCRRELPARRRCA